MGIGSLRRRYDVPVVAKAAPKAVEPKVVEVVTDEVVEEKPKAAPKTAK